MKKLLAAVLSCVMLFGLMIPMTVSADVPAFDGSTALRIQFEDYVSSVSVPLADGASQASSTTSTAAGDGLLMIDTRDVDEATTAGYSFDIQFTAPAGNYEFSYAHGTTFSGATFALNGAALSAGAKGADLAYPWGSAGKTYGGTVSIATAGTQTLTVTVNYNATRSGYLIMLDYFEIAPIVLPSATVTNADDTKIELADYAPYIAVPSSSGTQGASASADANGNQFIALNISGASVSSYTLEVPFTVAEGSAGEYNYSYVISDGLEPISFAIDTTTLSASANGTTYSGWAWGNSGVVYDSNARINLTAGDHVLKVTVSRNSGGRIAKLIGAFTFKPYVETTFTVTNAENAKLEVADYAYMVAVPISGGTEGASASGDANGNRFLALNAAGATVESYTLAIPFDVAEGSDGLYTFEYIIADGLDPISFAIDTTAVSGAATGVTYSGWNWGNNGVVYATSALTNLTAGRHTLNITFHRNSGGRIAKLVGAFTFKPFAEVVPDVSNVAPTRVEMENYGYKVAIDQADGTTYTGAAAATGGAGCSNGQYLQIFSGASNLANYLVEVPVNVLADGKYKVSIVYTSSFSNLNAAVNGVAVATDAVDVATEFNMYGSAASMRTTGWLDLTAGRNTVGFILDNRGGSNNDFVKGIDYIEITPLVAPVNTIPEEGTMKVEMEAYAPFVAIPDIMDGYHGGSVGTAGSYAYSGDGYLFFNTDNGNAGVDYYDVEVPFTVTTEGLYNFESVTNKPGALDNMDIFLDGVLLATTTDATALGTEFQFGEAGKYEKANVALTAEEHTLAFRVYKNQNDRIAKSLDYFQFAYVGPIVTIENGITYEEGVVSATYLVDGVESGTVLLALYNGKEFVGMVEGILADGVATAEYATTAAFTEAKVFVWADYASTFAPLVAPLTQGFTN